ncbi:MAG: branched-chain amino acid ABC transporter permease [Rhodospirillales bacterium]|nr:branched-chain amino acid ABC transporter permease [Rhodospirillales bacterium]
MTQEKIMRFILIGFVAILAAGPLYLETYYTELFIHMMVLGIFAMSLDLLIGYTGLVSFGHAAFFGLAGYLLAIVTPETEPTAIWISLPVVLAGCAIAAAVIGWFSVRTSGIYFIMITLAFAQMFFYYFNENNDLGGSDGMFISNKPLVGWGDFQFLDLENTTSLYYLVFAGLLASYFLLRTILNAPFGQVIKGIKANEHRTKALGYNTQNYKLVVFIIAGTMAGFAGFLEAASSGIVSPGNLHWHHSGIVIMLVILGGMGTLYGAVFGAFILTLLQDKYTGMVELMPDFMSGMADHWHLFQGIFIILVVLLVPNGAVSLLAKISQALGKKEDAK